MEEATLDGDLITCLTMVQRGYRGSLSWVLKAEWESGRRTKGLGGGREEEDIQVACSNAGSCEGEWHVLKAALMGVQYCEENRTYTNKWQNIFLWISITINQPDRTNKDTCPNKCRECDPCSKILSRSGFTTAVRQDSGTHGWGETVVEEFAQRTKSVTQTEAEGVGQSSAAARRGSPGQDSSASAYGTMNIVRSFQSLSCFLSGAFSLYVAEGDLGTRTPSLIWPFLFPASRVQVWVETPDCASKCTLLHLWFGISSRLCVSVRPMVGNGGFCGLPSHSGNTGHSAQTLLGSLNSLCGLNCYRSLPQAWWDFAVEIVKTLITLLMPCEDEGLRCR